MKRSAVVLLLVLCVPLLALAQETAGETARRLDEATNNLAIFADTFRVNAETTQQLQMEVTADGNRLTEKSTTTVVFTADVRELGEEESEAAGEFSIMSQESTVDNGDRSNARQAVSGEVRLVDDSLFVNVRAIGNAPPELPVGWTVLVKEFARVESIRESYLFEFPGLEELELGELRSRTPQGEMPASDEELFRTALELGSSSRDSTTLPDGTRADRLTVELTGSDAMQLQEFSGPLAELNDVLPETLVTAMLENMVMRVSALIDDWDFFRGFEVTVQLSINTDDLAALFGEALPPGVEGSIAMQATFTERIVYTNINAVVEPIVRP